MKLAIFLPAKKRKNVKDYIRRENDAIYLLIYFDQNLKRKVEPFNYEETRSEKTSLISN